MRKNAVALVLVFVSLSVVAAEDGVKVIRYHNYDSAYELTGHSRRNGAIRVVVGSQAGGRVLEMEVAGKQALYFDEKEKDWQPGAKTPLSAGRFDYGPELTVAPHPAIWSGDWTGEIVGPMHVKLTSPRDEAAGVQLEREFRIFGVTYFPPGGISGYIGERDYPGLSCRQTIINIGDKPIEVCHWGRSFSPTGGIALVPLGDRPSRFPSKYVMYEDSAVLNVRNTDEKIRERDGILEILGPPRKPKLGFDSHAGWVGYLMPNDTLFVKRFHTFPDRVYNEAAGLTLSIWYPQDKPVIEIEPIGPREVLQPGGRAYFDETWNLYPYPYPKPNETVDLKRFREELEFDKNPMPPSGKLSAPVKPSYRKP